MHAYDLAGWGSLLSAEVGAAAALTGLLFVAISINLSSIVANPILPSRAIDALCKLANVLMIASLGLVPGISARLFGWVALAIGLVAWFIPTWNQFMQLRQATAANDMPALAQAAHKLRGSLTTFGATRLAALCAQLESKAKAGALPEPVAALRQLESELATVSQALAACKSR